MSDTPPRIVPGVIFSTPFESGCVALSAPDRTGTFAALDSDGVESSFNVVMVISAAPSAGNPPEPAVCGGTGDHEGQPVDSCDECAAHGPWEATQ